ncbi:ARM repeat-containing protein [Metschnikowia bicuspidata var. bicuspidata NRRL YB-4993]|uniref:ARM repeat-containing protein n=1 Tax=Metschnikowia bicuspidata var. bicuspidata NRRL YB-4993 TaxID=869754 RepID=A0A1A0HF14_9ASCO|nr:ARM repeat-containing protein [Metschnikowia bicuspidata var. bicuspidata NRRL YB-4993]OBA22719.1 ARM repeat-containing protein [Metschnikowia bicuspidata var. bicuspidata NRRL YB-4993]
MSSPVSQTQSQLANSGFPETPNGYGGSRSSHGDSGLHYSGNRRNNHHMNGGVNIHRKMHNSNRRKGDDASKYANAKLEDFTGQIYSLCKDQHGCRFLQRQLDLGGETSSGDKSLSKDVAATMIFNELYLKIVELMIDPFGNYLIQKLFESVSADQRLILVKNAAPDFIRIALDPHGTRALQKLVECISTPEESRIVIESLCPHVVSLSRDLNGNHVVQKCLQRLKPEDNQFIFDTASMHCGQIATHRHGCCVLQRCLDHGNSRQRRQLSLKVAEISTNLSLDPFGNYVVQYVLTRGDEKSISMILDHILSHIVSLSLHKFGSNVIEKSLRINHLTDTVIDVLLRNQKQFSLLLNDPYGNYVLQTSLDVASPADLAKLAASLQPFLPNIKNTPHGRRILTKIQNIL